MSGCQLQREAPSEFGILIRLSNRQTFYIRQNTWLSLEYLLIKSKIIGKHIFSDFLSYKISLSWFVLTDHYDQLLLNCSLQLWVFLNFALNVRNFVLYITKWCIKKILEPFNTSAIMSRQDIFNFIFLSYKINVRKKVTENSSPYLKDFKKNINDSLKIKCCGKTLSFC